MRTSGSSLLESWDALSALVNLIVSLGDNKYFLGRRISEWATGAPTLEAAVACSAISQEELGQARVIQPLLEDLDWPGGPVPLEREGDRVRRYSVSFLDETMSHWVDVVAAFGLVDAAITTVYESLVDSRYEALASRVRRALDAEKFHTIYAEGQLRALAPFPAAVDRLRRRVDEWLPEMLCWFGPEGEPGLEALLKEGVLKDDNESLRQRYLDRIVPLFRRAGVKLPARWNDAEGRWEYGDLPWNRWDALQRRRKPAAIAS